MFKIPAVEGISRKLVQNCRLVRIPLVRPECVSNKSPMNRLILKWNQSLEPKTISTKKLNKPKATRNYTMHLLPDYSKSVPKKEPIKETKPIVPKSLTRNLDYITTEKYKRISPELYKLLQDEDGGIKKNEKTSSSGTLHDKPNWPDWAYHNPNLYKYLRQVMNSDNPLNYIYGIDFENNFDQEELEIYNMFDAYIAEDMLRNLNLFKLLLSGATLTPNQLQVMAQFLRNLVSLGAEAFDYFMSLLDAAGVDTYKANLYMRKLYQEIRYELSPRELKLLEDKLSSSKSDLGLFTFKSKLKIQDEEEVYFPQFYEQRSSKKIDEYLKKRDTVSKKKPVSRRRSISFKGDIDIVSSSTSLPSSSANLKLPGAPKEGFYPPWNIKINWAEKPRFYRYSTAVRMSSI